MEIKPIALAIVSLASSAAFAQSTNTVYGVVDVNATSMDSGFGQKLTLGHSGMSATRIGLNGERKFDADLSAIYVLEAAIALDTGVVGNGAAANGINNTSPASGALLGNGSQIFARQALFGVKSNLGSLTLGRQYSGSYGVSAMGNSMAVGMFGYSGAITPLVGGMPTRLNSSLAYSSPSVNGFKAQVVISTGSENNVATNTIVGTTTTNDQAGQGIDAALSYSEGPLNAAVTLWSVKNASFVTAGESDLATKTGLQIATNYDLGFMKLHGTAVTGKISGGNYENVTKTFSDGSAWSLSGSVPIGKGRFYLSYTNLNDKSSLNKDAELVGIGYTYSLYEKTTLYTSLGKMMNSSRSSYSLPNGGDLTGNVSTAGFSPTGLMVGINMSF